MQDDPRSEREEDSSSPRFTSPFDAPPGEPGLERLEFLSCDPFESGVPDDDRREHGEDA